MPREELERKLEVLEKERVALAETMKKMMIRNRQKATTEYDEMREKLLNLDMQVIELKDKLKKEGGMIDEEYE